MANNNNVTIDEVYHKIKPFLAMSGIPVLLQDIDGIIIKQISDSNLLVQVRTTLTQARTGEKARGKQAHIAITGKQMNMFPSIYMPGYITDEPSEKKLKKYMYISVPCYLYEANLNYLKTGKYTKEAENYCTRLTTFSVTRSRRIHRNGKDDYQIEIGHKTLSGSDFVSFRKEIMLNDYLFMIKLNGQLKYIAFCIRQSDFEKETVETDRDILNDCFVYPETVKGTSVNIQELIKDNNEAEGSVENIKISIVSKKINKPYNRILFGAPGTGKSFELGEEQKEYFDAAHFERVTFHPAYSYAQFFGSYKPVSDGHDIRYEFVCGPFLRVLLAALKNPSENYLLIIEEINRADVAAVFGDVFQLLDRNNGESEYRIDIPEDLKRYLKDSAEYKVLLDGALQDGKLYLPKNFYLWATMNSADQGVMPLDTAFKRRWNFEYLSINNNQSKADYHTPEAEDGTVHYNWLVIRDIINERLKQIEDIAEDRWLGPFFLHEDDFASEERFAQVFKSKVLMYLYQDIAKYAGQGGIFRERYTSYNKLCEDFDTDGMKIFAGCHEKYPQKQAEPAKDDAE